MGAFNLREPERHIEKMGVYLMKSGIRADKEKVKELVATFKKGDAKILYLRWLETRREEAGDPDHIPPYSDTCEWLINKYGKEKTTVKTLEKIAKRSRKNGWATRKFREEFTKAWDRKEGSITEEEGVRIFVEGLRGKVRDHLETKADLYDQRKDLWVATVGLLAEATTSKKLRKMDERKESLESSDEESESSAESGTEASSDSSESSSLSSSEEERKRRRKKVEKGKEKRSDRERGKGKKIWQSSTKAWRHLEEELQSQRLKGRRRLDLDLLTILISPRIVMCVILRSISRVRARFFDEMVKLGWHLKRDKGMIVIRDDSGVTHDVGHGYGRGGVAGVLVKDYPHLQKRTTGEGNVRMARIELVEDLEGSGEGGWKSSLGGVEGTILQKVEGPGRGIIVDERSWEELTKKLGVDEDVPLNVFVATKGTREKDARTMVDARVGGGFTENARVMMRAKGVSEASMELARAHLELATGMAGRVVMPLEDLVIWACGLEGYVFSYINLP
ncbi:hypothetical protein BC829DRAFT_419713 [Chytridium lagenaria]|nr:hypothetical protein BC829DRAFT_419713 [Chytridium lagenaria]